MKKFKKFFLWKDPGEGGEDGGEDTSIDDGAITDQGNTGSDSDSLPDWQQ